MMRKGDVILIPFPFTDLTGSKLRPAIVLAATALDVTLCFVTTQLKWQEPNDVPLLPSTATGVKKPSLIRTSKIATLDKALAVGRLGQLRPEEIVVLNQKLRTLLQLG